jgi:estrone sulfotransferase
MLGKLKIPVLQNASPQLLAQVPPIFSDDCLIVSYPRSGNIWVRFLIANLLENSRYPLSFRQMERYIPDIHCKNDWDRIRSKSENRILKSNMPYDPDYKKVIYIVRDGRDVMVSAYHYYFLQLEISFLDFLQMNTWPSPWHLHVLSWLNNAQRLALLLVRYEDLLKNPFQQLNKIADFIGLNKSDDKIERAVNHSSFNALAKMEANQTDSRLKQMGCSRFFRSGKAGQWRNFFGKEHKDVFKPLANPVLLRLGYINNPEW